MKAFVRTLFGDGWNIAGVAVIVAIGAALTQAGHPGWAVFAMPAGALAAVAWLVRR
jgi:hypothetical protein